MRIVLVSGSFPDQRCGVGDYAARLARELAARGVELEVLTSRDPLVRADPCEGAAGRRVLIRPEMDGWSVFSLPGLRRKVRRARPDAILLQYPTRGYRLGLAPVLLPRLLARAVPVVTTLHEYSIAHPLRRAAARFLASSSRVVIVSTLEERRAILADRPRLEGRLRVVPTAPAIEPADRAPLAGEARDAERREAKRRLGLAERDRLVVHFGAVSRNKGIGAMARAVLLLRESDVPAHLLWIGQLELVASPSLPGADLAALRTLREAGGLTVTGRVDPAAASAWLSAGEVGLFPYADGVSLRRTSFLSAARHALPLVSTTGPAVPPDLVDGQHALLAEPGDAQALARQLRAALGSADLGRRLGDSARSWSAGYGWDRVARGTIEALELALDRRPQAGR